jgi:glucose/mannose-6-phosphate isomerase
VPELLPDGPIDTLGLLDAVLGLPEQIAEADAAGPVTGLPPATRFDHVLVAAPGAAATAGAVVAGLASPVCALPVLHHRGGVLPAFVAGRSLLVVVSVDDDPAALVASAEGLGRGAQVLAVAPPGSELAARTADAGGLAAPVTVDVPVARAAAGALAVHVLSVLEQLGTFADVVPMVAAAVAQLELRRDELVADASPARRLARRIGRTLPVVYASDPLGDVAAQHWKRRVNLDAKAAAFARSLPEVGWDEVAGWGQHGDMTRQVFSLVTLRHDHEAPGVERAMAALEELLEEVVYDRHQVVAGGDGALAQLLDLVFFGDVTSWHLAQELEIDPGPTAALATVEAAVSSEP